MKSNFFSFSKLELYLCYVSGFGIFALMCLTCADIIGRRFLNTPVVGAVEISELLMIIVVYCAVGYCETTNTHINMDAIPEKFKRAHKWLIFYSLNIWNSLIPIVILATICYFYIPITYDSFVTGEASFGPLYIPYVWLKIILFLGLLFLVIRLAINIIGFIKDLKNHLNNPDLENDNDKDKIHLANAQEEDFKAADL